MQSSIPSSAHAAKASVAHTATHATKTAIVPRWLIHLGVPGLFVIAIIDSSMIPLPVPGSTDLLLLWLVSHGGISWLLAFSATAGSILGGYISWSTGKRGGEAALRRYVPSRHLERIAKWVESHSILAVFLPAILPPPMPLSPFLLASGALGVSRKHFLLAFSAARIVRYSLIAWLAVKYGRKIVRLWSGVLAKWEPLFVWIFVVFLVVGIGYGLWKFRREQKVALSNFTQSDSFTS